jgi:hypothetical protein
MILCWFFDKSISVGLLIRSSGRGRKGRLPMAAADFINFLRELIPYLSIIKILNSKFVYEDILNITQLKTS